MIPLEDNAADIIGKAQRGLGISDSELAEKAGVSAQTIRKLRDGDFDESALLSVAPVLGLDACALGELAKGEWRPNKIESFDGLAQFTTDYDGMAVNAYLVWDPATRVAAAFDTGADSREMVRSAKHHKLDVQLILLTTRTPITSRICRVSAKKPAQMFLPRRRTSAWRRANRRGKTVPAWQFANRYAPDVGSFPWRNDICCDRPCASSRHCGRFAFCRLDGRRQRVVSRCLTKQPRENSDLAGRNHHLPRTRPDDHSGRGETAQPVLCRQSVMFDVNFASDKHEFQDILKCVIRG